MLEVQNQQLPNGGQEEGAGVSLKDAVMRLLNDPVMYQQRDLMARQVRILSFFHPCSFFFFISLYFYPPAPPWPVLSRFFFFSTPVFFFFFFFFFFFRTKSAPLPPPPPRSLS